MLDLLARHEGDVVAVRVMPPPKSAAEQMRELGIDEGDFAENEVYFEPAFQQSLEDHLDWVFSKHGQRGRPATRFTDGSVPVLYTALEQQTAFDEPPRATMVVVPLDLVSEVQGLT
jgi:hypothetical protein